MKLYEYESKELARKYGIPVPRGKVAFTPDDAEAVAREIGKPVAVKSQVLVGRRGLAGGILFADTPDEARRIAEKLLGSTIRGVRVEAVLVEEKACIEKEYYLSMTVDRFARKPVILASYMGGVEVEELVREHPESLLKIHVDPGIGITSYMARYIVKHFGLPLSYTSSLMKILEGMWKMMNELDLELVEFNPLALTCNKELVALDAKIIVDDNSLYKHKEFAEKSLREYSGVELEARKLGFAYVELDGDIGIIGNGAGLTMATMDLVNLYGGKPANFLDVGGGASRERVKEAVKILLKHPRTKVVLVNIFGGITRCDEVAAGLVAALKETGSKKPVVVRLLGTNEEEGRRILREAGIHAFSELDDAVKKAVELAG
ncbi:ADP-forming succinate--CoA ligase subunit beta [Desulfurococcaceae archaeon MEX13E-LK6-19]|nr:ADP-forming succinate--CoA ligase subunit beta [Desulfurococcaceae archaeon MEX13E-LK6-19]